MPSRRNTFALVREVDPGQHDLLLADVLPHVELGPVRQREHPDVLARLDEAVVDVPELGPLGLRVPLAEVVAEREDALLRAGALLVAAGAAEGCLEAVLLDRVEQRHRLEPVARRARAALLDHAAVVDRVLHARDDQPRAEVLDHAVAVLEDLREVVARIDVHDRERQRRGVEGLAREVQEHGGVLAPRKQQHAALELCGHLANHVDGLGLEGPEVCDLVAHVVGGELMRGLPHAHTCSPHSVFAWPAQRPSRPLPGIVQGAHPMEA